MPRASPSAACISATAQQSSAGLVPSARRGETVRGHEFHYASLTEPGGDASLAELFDAEGASLGATGGRRGHVTGTFFHVVAAAEPHVLAGIPTPAMVESA